jgi:hypothetical protein
MTDQSVSTELAQIQETLRESPREYWRDSDLQERHLALLSNDAGTVQRAATGAASAKEWRELEKLMGDLSSAYWKGPEAKRLQARHLELIVAGMPSSTAADAVDEKALLEIPANATPTETAAAQKATGVLLELEAHDRPSMEARFNALPPAVIVACRDELAAPRPRMASPASADFLARFAASPRGRALVEEWGAFAAVRLGRIEARIDRLSANLPDAAAHAAFSQYMLGLSVDEARAIFQVMSV